MLNRSGESGHTCLLPGLRGKILSFSLLSMMLAVGFSDVAFIKLRYLKIYYKTTVIKTAWC